MKVKAVVMSLLASTGSAYAAEMATGGSGMLFNRNSVYTQMAERTVPPAFKPAQPAAPAAPTTPNVSEPQAPAPVPAPISGGPVQTVTSGTDNPCLPPRPYATETPFKIHVDQERQEMIVQSPDFEEPLIVKISSGGTLKIPNRHDDWEPHCARTKKLTPRIITAFDESEFTPSAACTPENIRRRATVFRHYQSRTFTTADGQGASMPFALRFRGGEFIHLGSEPKALGYAVSGGCVRTPGYIRAPEWMKKHYRMSQQDFTTKVSEGKRYLHVAETLYKQMKKHGAMEISISEPPPDPRCTPEMERQAIADYRAGRLPTTGGTGTEGIEGGIGSFFKTIGDFFSGGGSSGGGNGGTVSGSPKWPSNPPAQGKRPKSRDDYDGEWMQRALGGGSN